MHKIDNFKSPFLHKTDNFRHSQRQGNQTSATPGKAANPQCETQKSYVHGSHVENMSNHAHQRKNPPVTQPPQSGNIASSSCFAVFITVISMESQYSFGSSKHQRNTEKRSHGQHQHNRASDPANAAANPITPFDAYFQHCQNRTPLRHPRHVRPRTRRRCG